MWNISNTKLYVVSRGQILFPENLVCWKFLLNFLGGCGVKRSGQKNWYKNCPPPLAGVFDNFPIKSVDFFHIWNIFERYPLRNCQSVSVPCLRKCQSVSEKVSEGYHRDQGWKKSRSLRSRILDNSYLVRQMRQDPGVCLDRDGW